MVGFYSTNIVKKEGFSGSLLICDLLDFLIGKLGIYLEPVAYTEKEIAI